MATEIDVQELRELFIAWRRRGENRCFLLHCALFLTVIPVLAAVNLAVFPRVPWFLAPAIIWGFGLSRRFTRRLRGKRSATSSREEETMDRTSLRAG
jgi:hypothetical protein